MDLTDYTKYQKPFCKSIQKGSTQKGTLQYF